MLSSGEVSATEYRAMIARREAQPPTTTFCGEAELATTARAKREIEFDGLKGFVHDAERSAFREYDDVTWYLVSRKGLRNFKNTQRCKMDSVVYFEGKKWLTDQMYHKESCERTKKSNLVKVVLVEKGTRWGACSNCRHR